MGGRGEGGATYCFEHLFSESVNARYQRAFRARRSTVGRRLQFCGTRPRAHAAKVINVDVKHEKGEKGSEKEKGREKRREASDAGSSDGNARRRKRNGIRARAAARTSPTAGAVSHCARVGVKVVERDYFNSRARTPESGMYKIIPRILPPRATTNAKEGTTRVVSLVALVALAL